MFVDFNDTFKKKSDSGTRVPELVVEKLSEALPAGTRYRAGENGDMIMVSDSGQLTLGGFTVVIPETFKPVLGNHYTRDDVFQLSYNSQTPLELRLTHEGFIRVNGKEIPLDQLHYNVFHRTKLSGDGMMAYPPKFPEPFALFLRTGDGRYGRQLKMAREPYLSLDKMVFQSEDEQPFQLRIESSSGKQADVSAAARLELKYAKTIRDMVESIYVFNDLADGKAMMGSHLFGDVISEGDVKKFDSYGAVFWEKVLQIEELLGVQFIAPEGDTDFQTVCDVEWLYRNLICRVPIRQNQRLTSFTGKFDFDSREIEEKAREGKFYFQYQASYSFELFGIKIMLPAICGLFDVTVKSIEKQKNGKTRIELEDISPDRPAYTSVLCFREDASENAFIEMIRKNGIELLKEARPVKDYLQ